VPKDRKFANPLFQRSDTLPTTDTTTETTTDTSTETSTEPSTLPTTYTSTLPQVIHRKRGAQAFERTHERITLWIDRRLKQRFEELADKQGIAKATLLDEAITDLLKKYEAFT